MESRIIVVNEDDLLLRFEDKEKCHDGKGILHRAFSTFIFNNSMELLLQKRAAQKRLWPGYWSNSCCSHPRKNEGYMTSAERRLQEELGIRCRLNYLYKFQYHAKYKNIGSENEICAVLIGKHDEKTCMQVNPGEIMDIKWASLENIAGDIERNPNIYTPWFKMEINDIMRSHLAMIRDLCTGKDIIHSYFDKLD